MANKIKYLKEIYFLIGDGKKKIPGLVIYFLILSFLDVLGIGLIGPYLALISEGLSGKSETLKWIYKVGFLDSIDNPIIIFSILLILIFLVKGLATIFINRKIFIFGNSQVVTMRTRLMVIYQNMPYTDHISRNSSEYIQSTQVYAAQLIGIVITLCKIVCEGIACISIIAVLIYSQGFPPILLILFLITFIYLYNLIFSSTVKKAGKVSSIQNSYAIKRISESMEGFKEIKIFGRENYFTNKVKIASEIFSINRCKEQIIAFAPKQIIETMLVVFIVFLVISSLWSNSTNNILATLGMLGVASARLVPSTATLAKGLTTLQFSRYGISVLYNDIVKYGLSNKEILRDLNLRKRNKSFKNFELKNIYYNYPGSEERVIKNITINIKNNESIGIIGGSGAGKTTLVDIILGLMKPTKGTITYNGLPLHDDLAAWRSKVAYIPQQIFIIDDTLKRNIALGFEDSEIDGKKIMEAIKLAQLFELLESLPDGLDTILGERGVRLSGGQRQRVALARAFYHGRKVLVLDEATSALDAKTENQIVQEIKKFKNKKTIIVIAHRLSTVSACDIIYKLEKGEVVDFGPPDKILKKEMNLV